jgi:ankyrin repeat protein
MSIHDSIFAGKVAEVKRYLTSGGDVHARDALERTPLLMAAERGQVAIAELLLSAGANASDVDYRKFTPLHRAAGVGALELVEQLLAGGADACALNVFESTPLHEVAGGGGRATVKKRIAIIERLLTAGAPLDARDTSGRTPLWLAAATTTVPLPPKVSKDRLAVLKFLLEKGADPTLAASGTQGTPIDAARGLHQQKKYRFVWPEAVALLERFMR